MLTIYTVLLFIYGINAVQSIQSMQSLEMYADGSTLGLFVQAITNASRHIENLPGISPEIRRAVMEMYKDTNIAAAPPPDGLTGKCCGRYGCFTSIVPFRGVGHPLTVLPLCQNEMQINFYMWIKENPEFRHVIKPEDSTAVMNLPFRDSYCIFIFIHGYLGSGDTFLIRHLKDNILREKSCMFISVDWTFGARMVPHTSIANIQMVSAVVASLIQQIMDVHKVSPEMFHLAGHGLGAHCAGEVGKRIPGIGRITGLDPMKPSFEDAECTVRLSKTDALFVDIIHTDTLISGMKTPIGHDDIYVNGGYSQPDCFGVYGCDHLVSVFYFINMIQGRCPYLAYQCDGWDNFMRGKCPLGCGHENSLCTRVGNRAEVWRNNTKQSPAMYYMSAQASRSNCMYHYYVEINCTDDRIRLWKYGRNIDKLFINLIGANIQTGLKPVNENSIRFTTSNTITTLVISEIEMVQLTRIALKWAPSGGELPNGHCPAQGVMEPNANCCNEIFEPASMRCQMCPYIVSSIYVKNLETGYSARYGEINVPLSPNLETVFNLNNL